ncbi:hypothetical protein FGRMN_118 [Fusarium graminum]|nr:hypothetical protein FGRMN_118 [Fusarium graminum]
MVIFPILVDLIWLGMEMDHSQQQPLPSQLCDSEDWTYLNLTSAPEAEFRHVTDGLYEHFVVRNSKTTKYQAIFGTFPDTD